VKINPHKIFLNQRLRNYTSMRKFIHFILQLSKNDNHPLMIEIFDTLDSLVYLMNGFVFSSTQMFTVDGLATCLRWRWTFLVDVCIKHARVYIRKACQFLLSPNKTFFYEIELVSYQCILILNYRENVVCILQQCNPFGTIWSHYGP